MRTHAVILRYKREGHVLMTSLAIVVKDCRTVEIMTDVHDELMFEVGKSNQADE